jgi:hypothetical protein
MLRRSSSPSPVLDESRDQTLNPFLYSTSAGRRWAWGRWLLVLLLGLAALGQWGWLARSSLMQYSSGQAALESLCRLAACSLPQRQDLTKIQILSREMAALDERPDVLMFSLLMKNDADFAQPWPYLELELYGNDRKAAGKRIFSPDEYLGNPPETQLMQPGQTSQSRMELSDPGKEVTGFEMHFL